MEETTVVFAFLSTFALLPEQYDVTKAKDNADRRILSYQQLYTRIMYIDSMPLAVIKYTTLDNVTNTAIMEE